jgi:hypothetical protein
MNSLESRQKRGFQQRLAVTASRIDDRRTAAIYEIQPADVKMGKYAL